MLFAKLAIKSLKKNCFMNTLVVLQLAAILTLTVYMISSATFRFNQYNMFGDLYENGGCIVDLNLGAQHGDEFIVTSEQLKNNLQNADEVLCQYTVMTEFFDENEKINTAICAYDSGIIERYSPILNEGIWLNKAKDDDCLHAVITANNNDIHVGDILTMLSLSGEEYDVEIVGVTSDKTKVPLYDATKQNYEAMLYTYSIGYEEIPLIMLNAKELEKISSLDGYYYAFSGAMICYNKSITQSETEINDKYIASLNIMGGNGITDFDTIKEKSMSYIYSDIYKFAPIILCILVLTFVTTVCIIIISLYTQIRNYSIYCICGLQKQKCSLISLYSSLIISFVAWVCASAVLIALKHFRPDTVMQIGLRQILICVCITAVYVILTYLTATTFMKKSTIVQTFRE